MHRNTFKKHTIYLHEYAFFTKKKPRALPRTAEF